MKLIVSTFRDRILFLFEKVEQAVSQYSEVSTAEEKRILAEKHFQANWVCQFAGRYVV